tara:strand:+ start:796 stop:1938 length:1143 start_codon:yes stop_codon:yes gene_type:complete
MMVPSAVMTADLSLDEATAQKLQTHGFDRSVFETQRARLLAGEAGAESNRIQGTVTPPQAGDVVTLPPVGSPERAALAAEGEEAIRAGKVGAIILAGGMATRFGGVVKAGVEAVEGLSFLEVKVRDIGAAAERAGGRIPLFPMTSFATHDEVVRLGQAAATERTPIAAFAQGISLRLAPDGELFRDGEGEFSPYAPGHGDLPSAFARSGLLDSFLAEGGEILFMSNVDNLTATLDPAVIGAHLSAGRPMTAEMAPKHPGDKGGAPARVDDSLQIVEAFRFPEAFDQDSIPVFNTNTLVFDAAALKRDFPLDFFAVSKTVDGKPAIQFERLVGQLSAFLPCTFLQVAREGEDARFQPVKDPDELARRTPEIVGALRARGIL